jgi:2-polyprenyl-3-methyl-5-hydroxy-6-metoxy-1,4-benzoquinol methylase
VHVAARPPDPGLSAADAYEAIAAEYDRQIRGDEWMRRALHRHYLGAFMPGQRVLDLGCGTGTDALELARHGIHVLGIDASPNMVAQVRRKAATAGLEQRVESRALAIEELGQLHGTFDGAISSFAALSTVDLARFANDAARLVQGRMVLHLLNRFSLWEWLGALRDRQPGSRSAQTRIFTIGGQPVHHRLYFPGEAYRMFATEFRLRSAYSLGALRPPHTVQRVPSRLVESLEWLDVRLGALPGLRDAGRFFVLDLERRHERDYHQGAGQPGREAGDNRRRRAISGDENSADQE